jgi:hypothetical protein
VTADGGEGQTLHAAKIASCGASIDRQDPTGHARDRRVVVSSECRDGRSTAKSIGPSGPPTKATGPPSPSTLSPGNT